MNNKIKSEQFYVIIGLMIAFFGYVLIASSLMRLGGIETAAPNPVGQDFFTGLPLAVFGTYIYRHSVKRLKLLSKEASNERT